MGHDESMPSPPKSTSRSPAISHFFFTLILSLRPVLAEEMIGDGYSASMR